MNLYIKELYIKELYVKELYVKELYVKELYVKESCKTLLCWLGTLFRTLSVPNICSEQMFEQTVFGKGLRDSVRNRCSEQMAGRPY